MAQDLADRYGKPLIVLNLVKVAEKRPRESILQSEFANAISYINKGVRPLLSDTTHWLQGAASFNCRMFVSAETNPFSCTSKSCCLQQDLQPK